MIQEKIQKVQNTIGNLQKWMLRRKVIDQKRRNEGQRGLPTGDLANAIALLEEFKLALQNDTSLIAGGSALMPGKTSMMLLEFFRQHKKGDSIILATPHGNMYSQKAHDDTIKALLNRAEQYIDAISVGIEDRHGFMICMNRFREGAKTLFRDPGFLETEVIDEVGTL